MTVHFCPRCGRLNLADFVYCPYCGAEVAPGPGLDEALEKPFGKLEAAVGEGEGLDPRKAGDARARKADEDFHRLESELDALERDMEEFLREGRLVAGE